MNSIDSKISTSLYTKGKRTLIVGWNSIGLQCYNKFNNKYNIEIIGFINVNFSNVIFNVKFPKNLLGNLANINEIIRKYKINYIIVALDPHDYNKIHDVVRVCNNHHINYEIVSETYDVVYGHVVEQVFKELFKPGQITFRRVFDILSSTILLLFFLPLWIMVAIAIKLDSPGTVLFSQERVGLRGQIFRIYKFRTMVQDAEKLTGPILAGKKDPRVTRVGRFLRKTRIDEIPQLLNVLVGDMSMIGPRPERPYFVEKYINEIPMYKNRLKAKPGITGYAQVNLGYDSGIQDVKEKLKYDLYYINNASSLKLNLKIFIKTFWVIITGKGQ